jgi:hypothetical protein
MCLTSAAIGLAFATVLPAVSPILLPAESYAFGLGLSATQIVAVITAFR